MAIFHQLHGSATLKEHARLVCSAKPVEKSLCKCRDDVAYMYYRSLKTLKAPADLIRFLRSLTGEMPENAESPSGNEWCKEPI